MSRARWLQVNLYVHPDAQDVVLTRVVAPAAAALLRTRQAESWFFVRYADRGRGGGGPRHHLRVRLQVPSGRQADVERRFRIALARRSAAGRVGAVRRATYRREVARYGGAAAVGLAERAFAVDSSVAVAILRRSPRGAGRASLAVRSVEELLGALGLGPRRRRRVYAFLARLQVGGGWLGRSPGAALEELFRARRAALAALLRVGERQRFDDGLRAAYRSVLNPISRRLASLGRQGRLAGSVDRIAASLVHMHLNRLGMRNDREAAFLWCLWKAAEEAW
jgi:lantibiotic biosynthesis protein